MDVFQEAVKAAERRSGAAWLALSPSEQTRAIYQEMRRIDQEAAAVAKRPGRRQPSKGGNRPLAA